MGQKAKTKFEIEAEEGRPALVAGTHPITGDPILLQDPGMTIVPHKARLVTVLDAASFGAAVIQLQGGNKMVELTESGLFRYHDETGGRRQYSVIYKLESHETAYLLCLAGEMIKGQKALAQLHAQHPGALAPKVQVPEGSTHEVEAAAAWEKVLNFHVERKKLVKSEWTEQGTSITVEDRQVAEVEVIPPLWIATSPVYVGHPEHQVTLRCEVSTPQVDAENTITGKLGFGFTLWSPSKAEIEDRAMEEARKGMQERMKGLGLAVIRGSIE